MQGWGQKTALHLWHRTGLEPAVPQRYSKQQQSTEQGQSLGLVLRLIAARPPLPPRKGAGA